MIACLVNSHPGKAFSLIKGFSTSFFSNYIVILFSKWWKSSKIKKRTWFFYWQLSITPRFHSLVQDERIRFNTIDIDCLHSLVQYIHVSVSYKVSLYIAQLYQTKVLKNILWLTQFSFCFTVSVSGTVKFLFLPELTCWLCITMYLNINSCKVVCPLFYCEFRALIFFVKVSISRPFGCDKTDIQLKKFKSSSAYYDDTFVADKAKLSTACNEW